MYFMYIYIYMWIDVCRRCAGWANEHEGLAEYGWKPHRDVLANKKTIAGLMLLVCAWKTEGYGFIEFEISNSTMSTVLCQPARIALYKINIQYFILIHSTLSTVRLETSSRFVGSKRTRWFWGLMTDIQVDGYSHYCRAANSFNRLDRIYVSWPAWVCTQLHYKACLLCNPQKQLDRGGSDHAPFEVLFSPSRPKHPKTRPIPGFLFERPEFEALHEHYVRATGLDRLPTILRWETHKCNLSEVARRVRNVIMHGQFLDPQERLLLGNHFAQEAAEGAKPRRPITVAALRTVSDADVPEDGFRENIY